MKPNFLRPDDRYLALKAILRRRSLPSVPLSKWVGRDNQDGNIVAGAGPYTVGRETMLNVSDLSSADILGVAKGGAIPMIDPIAAMICVR